MLAIQSLTVVLVLGSLMLVEFIIQLSTMKKHLEPSQLGMNPVAHIAHLVGSTGLVM